MKVIKNMTIKRVFVELISNSIKIPVKIWQAIPKTPHCRFHPSCSNYFMMSVDKYGVIKGMMKGMLRILRCHPLSRGGVDLP